MKSFLVGALVVAALVVPAAAMADSCSNSDRAAPACASTNSCGDNYTVGNWVWLQGPYKWRFAPPGTSDSQTLNTPDQNGNYTDGQTSSLQGVSALCTGQGNASNVRPQATDGNGIQSGCKND